MYARSRTPKPLTALSIWLAFCAHHFWPCAPDPPVCACIHYLPRLLHDVPFWCQASQEQATDPVAMRAGHPAVLMIALHAALMGPLAKGATGRATGVVVLARQVAALAALAAAAVAATRQDSPQQSSLC